MSIFEDTSIIFITYFPKIDLLKKNIKAFKDFKIKIIDASPFEFNISDKINITNNIEIIKTENHGQGHAHNLGIKNVDTKFGVYIDIDAEISLNEIKKIYRYTKFIKNFSILVPDSNGKNKDKKISEIKDCEASILFFNISSLKNNKEKFDENIFLYFEELDFFSRLNKTKNKVLLLPKINVIHKQGTSSNSEIITNLKNLQQWHYLWSMYYVNKKIFNTFHAFKIVSPLIIKDIIKIIFYFTIFKFNLISNRFSRLSGVTNAMLGKKSFKRPVKNV